MFKKIFQVKKIDAHSIYYICGYPIVRIRNKQKHISSRTVVGSGLDSITRNRKIIVSLTTFPARIHKVHKTIENLLTQTIKPDKLILWLSEKEFPNKEAGLPENLLRLKEYGLTIGWCEYMRSYQKLVPTLMEYPNDIIITFDDDFYYPANIIEDLYVSYLKEPKVIHSHRIWRGNLVGDYMKLNSNKSMFMNKYPIPSYFNFLMGYGGVLYPPNALNNEVLNIKKFKELVPTHDDVWLWAMSVLGKTKTKQVNGFDMSIDSIEDTQQFGLCNINKKNSEGIDTEEGYNKIIKAYPEIRDILKCEDKNE